jgi:hypothetical protein
MAVIRRSEIEGIADWEKLAALEANLDVLANFVRARKDYKRAETYGLALPELKVLADDAALKVRKEIMF